MISTVPGTVRHEVTYFGTMVLHTVGGKSNGTEYDQFGVLYVQIPVVHSPIKCEVPTSNFYITNKLISYELWAGMFI